LGAQRCCPWEKIGRCGFAQGGLPPHGRGRRGRPWHASPTISPHPSPQECEGCGVHGNPLLGIRITCVVAAQGPDGLLRLPNRKKYILLTSAVCALRRPQPSAASAWIDRHCQHGVPGGMAAASRPCRALMQQSVYLWHPCPKAKGPRCFGARQGVAASSGRSVYGCLPLSRAGLQGRRARQEADESQAGPGAGFLL
jgi:hypothetical protein